MQRYKVPHFDGPEATAVLETGRQFVPAGARTVNLVPRGETGAKGKEPQQSDEDLIRAHQHQWLAATAAGDRDAVLALIADDAVFLTPGRPPFGKAEFAAQFATSRDAVRVAGTGEFEEIVIVDDVAYARATLNVTVTMLGTAAERRLAGHTLTVFRKQPDGRWLLARDANLLAPAGNWPQ